MLQSVSGSIGLLVFGLTVGVVLSAVWSMFFYQVTTNNEDEFAAS